MKRFLNYIKFQFQMLKMAHELHKANGTLRKTNAQEVMVVHFDPEKTSLEPVIARLEKSVSDPYKTLNGFPPMVVCMPFGMQFSSLDWENFVELLTYEQKKMLKNSLNKSKIELVHQ